MKKLICFMTAFTMGMGVVDAQSARPTTKKSTQRVRVSSESAMDKQLAAALRMAQSGQYLNAANSLFSLARRPELASERPQIKYILGLMLMELKLNQVAAFQFVDVIRTGHPRYSKQAIEKLSLVADELGDDTILNYAISRVNLNDIPAKSRDMVYFRLGEVQARNLNFEQAEQMYSKVAASSSYYNQALYGRGLSFLEAGKPDSAIPVFEQMLETRGKAPVNDMNRVAAQLSLARALYQKQDFDAAVDAYSKIPKDNILWHDAIFEQAWAMLRSARFRSALSNFHTLHSSYYTDDYNPESLLLRSIVYLYICKYDEMEKVLSLYENTYGPIRRQIGDFLKSTNEARNFYGEIAKAQGKKANEIKGSKIPYMVSRHILGEANIRRSFSYLTKLKQEERRIEANSSFKASPLGKYSLKILANREKNTQLAIGDMVKAHMLNMRVELKDLYEQAGFIRYEMITGQKEAVKRKIVGKEVSTSIDDKVDREFFVQNGLEYYPFQGEYWLDEVGNYHYLGKSSCE